MFRERGCGRPLASIARELNDRGAPCPSADPGRNAHRNGGRWVVTAVAAIPENPRYTGRQVWNRHGTRGRGPGGQLGGRAAGRVTRNPVTGWDVHLTSPRLGTRPSPRPSWPPRVTDSAGSPHTPPGSTARSRGRRSTS
ncbi:recombinase family protein [Lentzea sp. HUAS TT2]|uniref:recombinase family protein n=1 Tax=Lentzea sp. HUAS TT2 TaxID=3447454 RepID=UPI003F730A62